MPKKNTLKLAVIGGSGLYKFEGLKILKKHYLDTPFGAPSDAIIEGEYKSQKIYFIPRHGTGHTLNPSEIPYRANIFALKKLGVTHIIAVNAVGIMKEQVSQGDLVVPDQLFDRTKGIRDATFFADGLVGHIEFADPYCEVLRKKLIFYAKQQQSTVHAGGTLICMEGPQFSTRAESNFYRKTLSPSIIGMTGVPEAKLAREAEISYATLALATDYDCWHQDEDDVNVNNVVKVMLENNTKAINIIKQILESSADINTTCKCQNAANNAIMTSANKISPTIKLRLSTLFGKYFDYNQN